MSKWWTNIHNLDTESIRVSQTAVVSCFRFSSACTVHVDMASPPTQLFTYDVVATPTSTPNKISKSTVPEPALSIMCTALLASSPGHSSFQCCTLENGRAWYTSSRDRRHKHVKIKPRCHMTFKPSILFSGLAGVSG